MGGGMRRRRRRRMETNKIRERESLADVT